jgi:methyltransferase (TIGR00027 family)
MSDCAPAGVSHVSDTALWVAVYRAMETERPDAIFRDPHARRLAGERGEAIVRSMPKGRAWAWPMIVRTAVMDEIILRCVGQGVRTVVNLAAGLDARAYRLELPPALRWLHVDFPDMIAYVQDALAGERARCDLQYVAADVTDRTQLDRLLRQGAAAGPVLVVSEGLLIYLSAEQVGELAGALASVPAVRSWLIDLGSPMLLKMMARQWGAKVAQGNAPFRFAPAEGTAFFTPHGWREAEFRSTWSESLRLKRTVPLAWLWQFLGRFQPRARKEAMRRMSGVVLLERRGSA